MNVVGLIHVVEDHAVALVPLDQTLAHTAPAQDPGAVLSRIGATPIGAAGCVWGRGRGLRACQVALLWTGEHIGAQTELQWGSSARVPHGRHSIQGIEIARHLAIKPALYRSLQKQALNLSLRRRITQHVPFGMALEGLAAADLAYQNQG